MITAYSDYVLKQEILQALLILHFFMIYMQSGVIMCFHYLWRYSAFSL